MKCGEGLAQVSEKISALSEAGPGKVSESGVKAQR